MSAITFDTEMLSAQSVQDAEAAASARSDQRPGLFSRMLDVFGRAYTIEAPDGKVIYLYPPC